MEMQLENTMGEINNLGFFHNGIKAANNILVHSIMVDTKVPIFIVFELDHKCMCEAILYHVHKMARISTGSSQRTCILSPALE
jgi:hypothetical protein